MQSLFYLSAAWVLYTYAGHPVLLFLLARIRGRPWFRSQITPTVTVYVAAFNEAAAIERRIENLAALEYRGDIEIVIADDGSDDGTVGIASRSLGSRGRVDSSPTNIGKTATQNRVVPSLRSEIVIFSDATSQWPSDLVTKIVRHFADADVGAVAADVSFRRPGGAGSVHEQGAYWRYERVLRILGAKFWTNVVVSGTCYAIRRELFEPLPAEIAEDLGTPLNIAFQGYRVVFDPDIVAVEDSAGSIEREARMRRRISLQNLTAIQTYFRRAFSAAPFAAYQFFAHKVMRSYCWIALLVLFASNAILLPYGAGFRILMAGQIAFYFMASLGLVMNPVGIVARICSLPRYFVLLNMTYGLAQWDYWKGNRGARWQTER